MTQASEEFRVPSALRAEVERICVLTDALCVEHLDAEYARLCRKLVARDPGRGGRPWPDPRVARGGRNLVIRSRPVGLRTGDGA